MPGSRNRNFRCGDLAEGLGLELLRPFAFVAPVPRTEDIGIDAVATLIRRDGRKLYAEDSFLVQVKAASVKKITYSGGDLKWLRSLVLPLFIMSVNLKSTTIELYTTNWACGHPNFSDLQTITMHLNKKRQKHDGQEMDVWLGPPVLQWSPLKAVEDAFQKTAYEVLKKWVTLETWNVALRAIGMSQQMQWETNLPPSVTGVSVMHKPNTFKDELQKIKPYIERLIPLAHDNEELQNGLELIAKFMQENGVDPDPHGILKAFAKIRQEKSAQQPGNTNG